MSRQVRSLIIGLICVALLGGAFLGVYFLVPEADDNTSSTASEDKSVVLIDKQKAADGTAVDAPVKRLEVMQTEGTYVLSPNEENQLCVEAYADLLINTTEINTLVQQVSALTADREIAATSDRAADFGLDTPQAIFTATYHDDTTQTIELGDKTPLSDGYYLKLASDDAIYLVSTAVGDRLLKPSTTYIGTSVITAPPVRDDDENGQAVLSSMSLGGTVRAETAFSFRLRLDTDREELQSYTYITTSPSVQGINDDSVSDIVSKATALNAVTAVKAYPTADDLAEYGLTVPHSTAELTLAVQTYTEAETEGEDPVYSLYNAQTHTIRLGKADEDGNYYALIDDIDVVYSLSATAVPWAETQLTELANAMLYQINITKVSQLAVTAGGTTHTFDLTHDATQSDSDKSLTVTADGTTYSTDDFRRLYQVFMWIQRYEDTAEQPSGDPELTVALTYDGDKTFRASFYKLSTSLYLCQRDGGETYTVRAVRVKEALKQLENYLNGEAVTVNYAL